LAVAPDEVMEDCWERVLACGKDCNIRSTLSIVPQRIISCSLFFCCENDRVVMITEQMDSTNLFNTNF